MAALFCYLMCFVIYVCLHIIKPSVCGISTEKCAELYICYISAVFQKKILSDQQLFTNTLLQKHCENCSLFTVPATDFPCCIEVGRSIMAEYNSALWLLYITSETHASIVVVSYKTSCQGCNSTHWQVNACIFAVAVNPFSSMPPLGFC